MGSRKSPESTNSQYFLMKMLQGAKLGNSCFHTKAYFNANVLHIQLGRTSFQQSGSLNLMKLHREEERWVALLFLSFCVGLKYILKGR